jgi:RNA polymerase sigma-70 factor (ECF subfamily)
MNESSEASDIRAARAGDQAAFARLIEPYRHQLLIHCYRMLGSIEDAEDALQETFLRAWRRLETFEGRASFRAWCYKIATNAALDARDSRHRRSLPSLTHAPADPGHPLPPPIMEPIWLEPLPDAGLPSPDAGPEAQYDARESVALAFLAALQHLPGRQRAALILRDVLAWQADEVASLLGVSVASVNSALQRARSTMRTLSGTYLTGESVPAASDRVAALLAQYVKAWETGDVPRLTALLHEDAVMTMPPLPAWYQGRAAIESFLRTQLFAGADHSFRLLPTHANGSPAFAAYVRGEDGIYRHAALQVLQIAGDRIAAIHDFLSVNDRLFARFDLPLSI